MEMRNSYYNSQVDAIQKFYHKLLERDDRSITLSDAIITWFTDGHAEKFRQEYLRQSYTDKSAVMVQ